MTPPDQPSLFETTPAPRDPGHARPDFLAGMLGQWLYGDRRPPAPAREALAILARRLVADAQMIRDLHP